MAEFKGIDLSLLTDPQLLHLLKRVEVEIAIRRAAGKRLVSEALREGEGPRYRNPDNATETWSGRGKMPNWVQQALAGGASLADLENADNRPVHRRRRRR